MSVDKLNIFLQNTSQEEFIGQLVLNNRKIFFKYNEKYLKNGFNISPLKLKFDNSIQAALLTPFDGLFGVFSDSLPDAWGKLLLKKHLLNQGIAIESLTPLDFLSFIGNNGSGALVYKPTLSKKSDKNIIVDLDKLNGNMQSVLSGDSGAIIDEMFQKGGSPGGARPKIYANYDTKKDELSFSGASLGKGEEPWIIKFASLQDDNDVANIELAYHYMAINAGLEMEHSQLFTGASGNKYFGTKRFDRIGEDRIHMISVAGLLHDNYEYSQLDYGNILQVGSELTNNALELEKIFRAMVFNVLAHNRDDHSKNFAFLMSKIGKWTFSPSYDLTFSYSSQGEHSTTCAGNGRNPGIKELLELGVHFSVSNASQIINQVKDSVLKWEEFAERAGVSEKSYLIIKKVLNKID